MEKKQTTTKKSVNGMNLFRYFFSILSLFSLFTLGRAEELSDQSRSSNPKAPESLIRNVPSRPNILFIAVDQLTSEAISCAGNPYVRTPAIDSLAARGIRFSRSYCTDPVCTPSRASWYTSRMPHEVKIQANPSREYKVAISNEFPSMGKLFQSNGYETNFSGKWHVPDPFPGLSHRLIPGFNVLPMSELSKEEILSDKGEKEDENMPKIKTFKLDKIKSSEKEVKKEVKKEDEKEDENMPNMKTFLLDKEDK